MNNKSENPDSKLVDLVVQNGAENTQATQRTFSQAEILAMVDAQEKLSQFPDEVVLSYAKGIAEREAWKAREAQNERIRLENEAKERARIAEEAATDSKLLAEFNELKEHDDLEAEFYTASMYKWDSYEEDYAFEGVGLVDVNDKQLGIDDWVHQNLPAGLRVKVTLELIAPTNGEVRKRLMWV